jgi:hypothetical protein
VVGTPTGNPVSLNILPTFAPVVENILDAARDQGIGLIVCPIWNLSTIAALFGDSTGATLLNPASQARQYIREFHRWYVQTFSGHPGVAAWMISQEIFNFQPFAGPPQLFAEAGQLMQETAAIVRAEDPWGRMITTCNNGILPQPNLADQYSLDEYLEKILPIINPDPIDTVSQTLFCGSPYLSTDLTSAKDYLQQSLAYLQVVQAAAKRLGKPLHVASFGLSTAEETRLQDVTQRNLSTFIEYMGRTGVQLASYWVWNTTVTNLATWNVLVTDANPANFQRPAVFEALKIGRSLMKAWPSQEIDRKPPQPAFPVVARFRVTHDAGTMFKVISSRLNSASFSLSYTARLVRGTQLNDVPFFEKRNTVATGWSIAVDHNNSYLQLWTSGFGPKLGRNNAPMDVPGEWVRITWTVKAGEFMRLYVNDFAWVTLKSANGSVSGNDPFHIGRLAQTGAPLSEASEWDLSDLIFYDRALTPMEVYEYGQFGTVRNPVGRWKLDGDLQDASGHGLHGVPYDGITNIPAFIVP